MEELWEIRQALEAGNLQTALALVDEMEEMSRDDKVQKLASYMRVLLVHRLKQAVEGRSTKSWDVSIRHALRQIAGVNKRRQAGGWYLSEENLAALLAETYESALDWASLEVHEGIHSAKELARMHDQKTLLADALTRIRAAQQQKEGHGE
jgi:predicted DNA-binding ribbon-helix-helix protein